jgi:hypothetical protein
MTIAEICLALDQDLEKEQPPTGGEIRSKDPAAIAAWVAWRRGLSVEDRLRMAREGR